MNVSCAACKAIVKGFKFTDKGWLCETCVLGASSRLVVLVIAGQTYVERQKELRGVTSVADEIAAIKIPVPRER